MSTPQNKKLILIGLGNPGADYANSYHNAGRLFVNFIAAENNNKFKKGAMFEYAEVGTENKKIILVRPLVFMNMAGDAAFAATKHFGVKSKNLIVVHDDSDIEMGKYKLSFGRGAGGHKGVESVIKKLCSKDFGRVRIGVRGVRKPGEPRLKAEAFVLKNITRRDLAKLHSVFVGIKNSVIENDTLPPASGVMADMGN